MKRLIPVLAAVLLIVALVFVKGSLDKSAPSDHDDDETQTSQKAPTAPPAVSSQEAGLLPEEFIGASGAKYHYTVGWRYDESNQANTKPLEDALQAVKMVVNQSNGQASAEIVDIDIPLQDRSPAAQTVAEPGIALNGAMKPASSGNPGEGTLTAQNVPRVMEMLSSLK